MNDNLFLVVGIADGSYSGSDGRIHKGILLFVNGKEPLLRRDKDEFDPEGNSAYDYWVANSVLEDSGFIPSVGSVIKIITSRYGKQTRVVYLKEVS